MKEQVNVSRGLKLEASIFKIEFVSFWNVFTSRNNVVSKDNFLLENAMNRRDT